MVFKLLWNRALDFFGELACPSSSTLPETPAGLHNVQTAVAQLASVYGKICNLNRMVFGPLYSSKIKILIEDRDGNALTPRRNEQCSDIAGSPSTSEVPAPPQGTGLTPRKEKKSKKPEE